jgi:outer membrane receptor for ferrienterochelin and colicins
MSKLHLCRYLSIILIASFSLHSNSSDLFELSLEELINLKVETASKAPQELKQAPATMVVVTAADIKRQGYTNIQEILADVGGYDTSILNAAYYSTSYQRGIRTLGPNRTLFMIDGIVSTLLWDAATSISRQYPLNHIQKIEFLFGPVSAVYGPNAMAGIINVITKKSNSLISGDSSAQVDWQVGSFGTQAVSLSFQGRATSFSYSLGVKSFYSDEPDHSDRLGYLSNDWYSNRDIWGPMLDFQVNGKPLGSYYDPSENQGLFANISFEKLQLDFQQWKTIEGYGPFYAADRVQNNVPWEKSSRLFRVSYKSSISDDLSLSSEYVFRENFFGGDWVEAEPDWEPGQSQYSYISYTSWKTESSSTLIKQDLSFQINSQSQLQFGLNYERKQLTKQYDIPGYWTGSYSSSTDETLPGPYGFGSGIYYSNDPIYVRPPQPSSSMPSDNLIQTKDYGVYALTNISDDDWRYHIGVRFDENSVYGSSFNPRLSVMKDISPDLTLKAVYGEAFQEPPALELYGGWNGRFANPNLLPEELRSLEFIMLFQNDDYNIQTAIFGQSMKNVLEFDGNQSSTLDAYGLEFRSNFLFRDLFTSGQNVIANLNYSYTDSKREFEDSSRLIAGSDAGAIAPHKLNMGFHLNLGDSVSTGIRANYIDERSYSQGNALRSTQKIPDFWLINWVLIWDVEPLNISLKINNLLDKDIFVPDSGCGCAGLYANDGNRSQGYTNPLIPQPRRSINLIFSYDL